MKRSILLLLGLAFTLFASAQQRISLNSGDGVARWAVRAQADESGAWVEADVPGTVFGSYVSAGLESDPNFGDNVYKVDKAKYDRNFWYRGEFETPTLASGERLWLNFEGVNRKGEVIFNGVHLGLLDGFMQRGCYDVTELVRGNAKNELSVLVHWVGLPVPNYKSPTYIASASWDWMPYAPGLLSGITDDVYLTTSYDVTMVDPWIRTSVPSVEQAHVRFDIGLENHSQKGIKGEIKGVIMPGNISFTKSVELSAGQQRRVEINEREFKQLTILSPRLWWPNGYGEPNLYTCELSYSIDGNVSDSREISFGIREYDYQTVDDVFRLKINGQPIYVKGGNWGMSEWLLRCRGEEYDLKLRLHKEMNYNMVRNWIGSVTDQEFYHACDKYGIMVWDDFWLNSHPNLPEDLNAFHQNAIEKIKRLRNHPSIAVWCGDNEGVPLAPLNDWLRGSVAYYDGGDRLYQAISNAEGLSGSGPWANASPSWYFTPYPMQYGYKGEPSWGFRTEIGTAVFTTFESFKKFMPEESWWPRNEMWDLHFFGPKAANAAPDRYVEALERNYGKADGIEDFCRKSQLLNIEVNKAMYEGWQHHMWRDATGILTWMSQSAYPSFVWQTYDYYYDLTGAYWGVKQACEPVHIQWSSADNSVRAINTTLDVIKGAKAIATIYNLDGKPCARYTRKATADLIANDRTDLFYMDFVVDNIAYRQSVTASSTSHDAASVEAIVDGSDGSRWASNYTDNEWVCVDLGQSKSIGNITLKWEDAHATAYKIELSDDGAQWRDVYATDSSKGGCELISFPAQMARYVRMQGLKRASQWGYSLYEMEVYGPQKRPSDLSAVHFIRLELRDATDKLLSENLYWRGTTPGDYTALNSLAPARVNVSSSLKSDGAKSRITAIVKNTGRSVAFAVHLQPYRKSDGERLLPVIMNDNYFTLMPGQSRSIEMEFDTAQLPDGRYELRTTPYNHK